MDKVEDKSPIDSHGNIPFHMAAISGQSCVYKYIIERLDTDNTQLALCRLVRGSKMLMLVPKDSENSKQLAINTTKFLKGTDSKNLRF